MKEIKYILHAFLLLLACITVFICLDTIYGSKVPESTMILTDHRNTTPDVMSKGKQLFQSKCASCHHPYMQVTGPPLCGVESRGPWSERENLYRWVKNPTEFMSKNEYVSDLKKAYGNVMMTAFPELSKEDIDEIINYINSVCVSPIARN